MGMGESGDEKLYVPCLGPSRSVDTLIWPAITFAIPARWKGFDFVCQPLPRSLEVRGFFHLVLRGFSKTRTNTNDGQKSSDKNSKHGSSQLDTVSGLQLNLLVFRSYPGVDRVGEPHLTTTYSVDPVARLVLTRISPPLTLGDLIALGNVLRKDPSFDPTFDELLDVSPGSAVGLPYADVQAATSKRRSHSGIPVP